MRRALHAALRYVVVTGAITIDDDGKLRRTTPEEAAIQREGHRQRVDPFISSDAHPAWRLAEA